MLIASLVPWRFFLLTVHFVALVLFYFQKYEAIQATLPPYDRRERSYVVNATGYSAYAYTDKYVNERYRDALWRVDLVLWLGYLCVLVEYAGLLSCLSLDWPRVTLFHVWCHAVGSVWTLWAQIDGWTYVAAEYQFVLCVLAPAAVEAAVCYKQGRALYKERRMPRVTPPRGPVPLRTWLVVRLILMISSLVLLAIGIPLSMGHLHKDRMRHDKDGDTGLEHTPVKALGHWFWTGGVVVFLGLALGVATWYVHYFIVVGHPDAMEPINRPRPRREERRREPTNYGDSIRKRMPRMLSAKKKKRDDDESETSRNRGAKAADSDSDDDRAPAPASEPLLGRRGDSDSDEGLELPRRGESKVDSDLSDSDESKDAEAKPLTGRTPAPAAASGPRRRRGADDDSLDS